MEPEDKNKKPEVKEVTMDDLKGIVAEAVKDSTAEQIEELKKDIASVEQKAVFPTSNLGDDMLQSTDDSVVDTSLFHKSYAYGGGSVKNEGMVLGKQLVTHGGIFKKLSPQMEIFAKMIKCRFNGDAIRNAGVDVKEYNSKIAENMKAAGMSEGVNADGGYLVPEEFMATVIQFAVAQSNILNQVFRIPQNSNLMKIPKLVQASGSYFGGVTLHWTGEGKQKQSTKPTFTQLEFTPHKLIGLVHLTDELIADSAINIVNYVTGLFTRAFQYEMERVIINGSGSSQPLGIRNDPETLVVSRTTSGTIVFDDLVNMDTELDESFPNLTWITRKRQMGVIRKLKDTTNQPIFHADYATFMGQRTVPPNALGYPIELTRNIPVLGSDGDLILGDLSQYIWTTRQEITVDTSIHLRFDYDETSIRFVARVDGKPGVSIAFAKLGSSTS